MPRNQLASATAMACRVGVLLALWVGGTALGGVGCANTDLVGNNCVINGQPCDDPSVGGSGGSPSDRFETLDLLVVIDNTPAMAATQTALAAQLPIMLETLLSGDMVGDARPDFQPVADVHVAVVSSDMGAPGLTGLDDCGEDTGRPFGDDGVFFTSPPNAVLGQPCPPSLPSMLTLQGPGDAQLSRCYPLVGTAGCRHVMPLEAALKAMWDRNDSTVRFMAGVGHGITTQPGFVRQGSLLAILIVTDNDDCSSVDLDHLVAAEQLPDGPLANTPRNQRCSLYRNHHHDLLRYREAFATLVRGQLSRLFVGVIAGVPSDFASQLAGQRIQAGRQLILEALLDDARMAAVLDPDVVSPAEPALRRSCGSAAPPNRLVEFVRRLEDNATVASICDDMSVSMGEMTRALARRIDPTTDL